MLSDASSQRDALLGAVRADPDENVARLALADWLAGHGDPDRAQLIRVQVELPTVPKDTDRRDELEMLEKQLLRHHGPRCAGAFRNVAGVGCEFDRGLLVVSINGSSLLDAEVLKLAGAPGWEWVTEFSLHLWDCNLSGAMLASPLMRRVTAIFATREWQLKELAAVDNFPSLRVLDVDDHDIGDWVLRALVEAPWLGQLRVLDLARNCISDDGARVLARSAHVQEIAHIDLEFNWIQRQTVDYLEDCLPGVYCGEQLVEEDEDE